MVDIKAVRNYFYFHKIANVGRIRYLNNPEDALTKIMNCSPLESILLDIRCNFQIEQCVYRLSNLHVFREIKSGVCFEYNT